MTDGFARAQASYDAAEPTWTTTDCPGFDEDGPCESQEVCLLCDGVVCSEHDEHVTDESGTYHAECVREERIYYERTQDPAVDEALRQLGIAEDRADGR